MTALVQMSIKTLQRTGVMNSQKHVKKCGKCNRSLPIDCFFKRIRSKDGLSWSCKECSKQYQAAYYETNKQRISTASRAYHQANKNRLNAKRYARDLSDPEAKRARGKAWRDLLPSSLIRQKLARGTNLLPMNIPDSLVELKRINLMIFRELKKDDHENRQ